MVRPSLFSRVPIPEGPETIRPLARGLVAHVRPSELSRADLCPGFMLHSGVASQDDRGLHDRRHLDDGQASNFVLVGVR